MYGRTVRFAGLLNSQQISIDCIPFISHKVSHLSHKDIKKTILFGWWLVVNENYFLSNCFKNLSASSWCFAVMAYFDSLLVSFCPFIYPSIDLLS